MMKPQTLMVAIQCVAAQMKLLDKELNEGNPTSAAELVQLLASMDIEASAPKAAHLDARQMFGLLPAYELLISQDVLRESAWNLIPETACGNH